MPDVHVRVHGKESQGAAEGKRRYSFVVYGVAAAQGSKRFLGIKGGKGILVESCKRVKPWRESVKYCAIQVRGTNAPLDGPLRCTMVFTLPKPASAPKKRQTWPDRKPDLSKLIRSTEDALVDSGIILDDARIIDFGRTRKCYPNEDPDALAAPGVKIELEALT
jgi:crossover junction endodeoxyribonuclease RusA